MLPGKAGGSRRGVPRNEKPSVADSHPRRKLFLESSLQESLCPAGTPVSIHSSYFVSYCWAHVVARAIFRPEQGSLQEARLQGPAHHALRYLLLPRGVQPGDRNR